MQSYLSLLMTCAFLTLLLEILPYLCSSGCALGPKWSSSCFSDLISWFALGLFHACLGYVCAEQRTGCTIVSNDCRHGGSCPGADGAVLALELEMSSLLLDPLAVPERCWSAGLIGPLWSLAYLQAWWIGYKVVPSPVLRFIFPAWFLLPAAVVDWSWKDRRHVGLGSHPGLPCPGPGEDPACVKRASACRSSSRKVLCFSSFPHGSSGVFYRTNLITHCFPSGAAVKNLPANAEDTRDTALIFGSGRSLGVGNGNLLQYFCLENSMDRETWQTAVHGVAKSWTRLSTHK